MMLNVFKVLTAIFCLLVAYTGGQSAGRKQVFLEEVKCVEHPLHANVILCRRTRVTEELKWKS